MSTLHPDTASARVSLLGCASYGTPFGNFKSNGGRDTLVTDRERIEFYLRVPSFKVIQLDANDKVVANSEEEKVSKAPQNGPIKVTKMQVKGDGWGEVEMQDEAAEKSRAEQQAAADAIEKEWLEEESKADPAPALDDDEIEAQREVEQNEALRIAGEDKSADLPETKSGIMDEVFSPRWTPRMGKKRLAAVLESRTGKPTPSNVGKRDIVKALEALDEE